VKKELRILGKREYENVLAWFVVPAVRIFWELSLSPRKDTSRGKNKGGWPGRMTYFTLMGNRLLTLFAHKDLVPRFVR
jgi:hypothetical protein